MKQDATLRLTLILSRELFDDVKHQQVSVGAVLQLSARDVIQTIDDAL